MTGSPRPSLHPPDPARGDRGRHARRGALPRARAGRADARRPRRRCRGGGRPPAGVRPGQGDVGARDAPPRRPACGGARRPVRLGALPGARRGRAPGGRRARRDPLRARPGGRTRRPRPTPPSTWSARPRPAVPPACARTTGSAVLHLVAGRASKAADVLESALADVHEEDEAAKPLLETLIAAGFDSATVRRRLGDIFSHLKEPRGTPQTDFERFALITGAFLAVVEESDAAARHRPRPPGARRRGARLLRVRDAGERRAADALVHPHAAGALRRVARDPRRAGARGARLRRPLGRRRLPGGARVDQVPRGQRGGRRGRRLRGAPDRARDDPRPRPRADRGIRGGARRHGAGAALRGARGDRGRAAAGGRPGHRGPGRPHARARVADARPGRRPGRRRRGAQARPRGLLGLQLAHAPSVALRGVGGARAARRGGAGARPRPGGAAARAAARYAARGGHRPARGGAGGAAGRAPGGPGGRGGHARERRQRASSSRA